jgi:crotonobetainyl-CoA:carnitine CoA-transferase CaiB-like acyl-CoA transferase
VFRRLLETADVLLENFRPGVLARLGFGWEELRRDHPGIVYCAVSGFGATGPESDRPAYDQVVQGLSGIMSVTGSEDTAPLRVGYPVCDSIGGLAAAFAISSALVRKARTGEGAYLDVSMLDAALSTMGWVVSDYLVAGRTPQPMGNENRTSAPSGTFETADGALNIAANKQEQWLALCTAIGREELTTDPRFASRDDRKQHRTALKDELHRTLRDKPASHWDAVLRRAGVPAAPVATVPEALDSPQVRHRGLVGRVDSAAGPLDLLGLPTHVDGGAVPPAGPPPVLGEHTDEVLREAGLNDTDLEALRAEGAI